MILDPARIILVTGVGGTGKSTLVHGGLGHRGLVDYIDGACVVSKDTIGDEFIASRGDEYIKNYRNDVYEKVLLLTRQLAGTGKTVIIDASHRSQVQQTGWEQGYKDIANDNNAILKIVRLVAPAEVL